ncbi:MAG: DUF5908 family protein [Proteobacteria bacterium]|nr:DUF5908 family protein [Pseudomonadota bacterium]
MPLTVRELVVRATVLPTGEAPQAESPPTPAPNHKRVVEECVEQVLEILRREEER